MSATSARVVALLGMLAFSAFALWLTASHFDASELKTLGVLTAGFVTRELLPMLGKLLSESSDHMEGGRGGR